MLRMETLEDRVVLSVTPGPPVWAGSEVIEPAGVAITPIAPPDQGLALWTPTADLVSGGERLFINDVSVTELRARAADPAYANVWDGLVSWSQSWPNQSPYAGRTAPYPLGAEDPWRDLAEAIKDTLVVYVATPDAAERAEALGTLETWFTRLSDWFDADNVVAPGSRSGATPTADLTLSQLITTYAMAYDWLKNDPAFSDSEIDTVRNTLIQLTRSLTYDQSNGGPAAQWTTGYQHNHNHWNYYALASAGAALYAESAAPLTAGEAHGWLDAGVSNFYYVFRDLPEGGAPPEGYLYLAYGDDPLFGMHELVDSLLNVDPSYFNHTALNALSDGLFYATLPDGYGTTSFYHDNTFAANVGMWSQHYLASTYGNPRAQFNANRLAANTGPGGVDWESMFFYDPSAPGVDRATQARHFDDNDMGLYYARSSWDDASEPTILQYHAGPAVGQISANNHPPGWGELGGHVTPEQGHVQLYSGTSPVLPTGGYTALNSSLEYNVVVFGGREGQAGLVGFDGSIGADLANPVGQLGGDSPFLGGDFDEGLDHARTLRTWHDDTRGVHGYLSDLGGRYRLDDARSVNGVIDPSYQRFVFYLETGAVAIVDRVKVDHPRDIYFRVPLYESTLSPAGDRYFFTTVDGVNGSVANHGSSTDGTLSIYTEDYESNSYASGESLRRDVVTYLASDATEAVFATVIGVESAGFGVQLDADTAGVTLNGVEYQWGEAARGDTSVETFAGPGFFAGQSVQNAPNALGRGQWANTSGIASTAPAMTVQTEAGGNAYLAATDWSAGVSNNDTVQFDPLPQDLGLASWADLEAVNVSFDLQLFDPHVAGNTSRSWEIEIGRDAAGLDRGLGAEVRVLSDGSLQVETGAGVASVAPVATGEWINVSAALDYTDKTVDLSVGGSTVVSNVPFDRTRADYFGALEFTVRDAGLAGHRDLGIDNVSLGAIAPSGASTVVVAAERQPAATQQRFRPALRQLLRDARAEAMREPQASAPPAFAQGALSRRAMLLLASSRSAAAEPAPPADAAEQLTARHSDEAIAELSLATDWKTV